MLVALSIVTVHAPVPEHAPDQPSRLFVIAGEASRVTVVPYENAAEQVPGQEMPEGELLTVPLPLTPTVRVCVGSEVNVAVTLSAPLIVTAQAPVPEQAPDQPVNLYPMAGKAESVTEVPSRNEAEQVLGQEMPEGELVTVPVPLTLTVSASSGLNVAVQFSVPFIVTV
jgi:hypothetical protein